MKIRLERDVLAEAVQWAARSLPTRPSVPILAGLLVRANADGVVFSGFDYETSARISVKAEVSDEGEALISGRLLADISRSLPAKPVDITADDTRMQLVCGSARFTLQTLPVADYPALPELPEATGAVTSAEFAQAVSQVVVAAGRDELLPVFTGVRVEIEGDTISLLATDRYRMALKEITWRPQSTNASAVALVPAKVLSDTARSMTAGEEVVLSLSLGHGGICPRRGDHRLRGPRVRRGPTDHDPAAGRGVPQGPAHHGDPAVDERPGEHRRAGRGHQAGRPGGGAQHVAADVDRRRLGHPGSRDRRSGAGIRGAGGDDRPARRRRSGGVGGRASTRRTCWTRSAPSTPRT